MASVIDIDVYVGETIELAKLCPTATSGTTPYIKWSNPAGINQLRYSIRIIAQEGTGEYYSGEVISSETNHQFPLGSPMSENFNGLLIIEVAISEDESGEYEYSSGLKYYVLDSLAENLYNASDAFFQWKDSYDPDSNQDLIYNLLVSKDPTFTDPFAEVVNTEMPEGAGATTSYFSELEVDETYFWKVRAWDGYDYGEWTKTNGFINHLNYPPEVEIISATPTENEYGDVIIVLQNNDEDGESINIRMTYTGGSVGSEETRMSLVTPLILVPNGEHTIVWRSGRDEPLTQADDYVLFAVGYDSIGYGFKNWYGPVSLDNTAIGGDTGGIGAIDTSFPLTGNMAKIIMSEIEDRPFPLEGGMLVSKQGYSERSPILGNIETWRIYKQGLISKSYRFYVNNKWGDPYIQGIGDKAFVLYPYPKLDAPQGSKLSYNRTYSPSEDLDNGDPEITSSVEYVGSNGWHVQIDEKNFSREQSRYGYIRFIKTALRDKHLCTECGGKGWNVEDLIEIGDGFYKRQPCSSCGGSRFSNIKLEDPNRCIEYAYSEYKPIEDWISPLDKTSFNAFQIKSDGITAGTQHIFGAPVRADDEWPRSGPLYANTLSTVIQKDGGSFYPHMVLSGNVANKVWTDYDEGHAFPIEAKEIKSAIKSVNIVPLTSNVRAGKQDYITGYSPAEASGFYWRDEPLHRWERGSYHISGNLVTIRPLEPLQIIYLQSGWDRYNTLHWSATASSSSMIQLEVAKYFEDGSKTDYTSVISEGSIYYPELNTYLIPPLNWHTYWDTVERQLLEDGYDYRLRVRQYDTVTNTYSQWVYSNKFFNDRTAPNPPNIVEYEYDRWKKILYVTFRLDDTQNDRYDITKVWYSSDGNVFNEILSGDIVGEKNGLTSDDGINEHTIGWRTSSYNLDPGDAYRIRIEVMPSKYAGDWTPPFLTWQKDNNPAIRKAELEIFDLNGSSTDYVYNSETEQFEHIESPTVLPGRIDRTEVELEYLVLNPDPSGKWNFFNPPHESPSGVLVDPSGYQEWLYQEVVPGVTRSELISNKAEELDYYRNVRIPELHRERDFAEMEIRKDLINQGYYNNGYIGNDPANGIFRFRVESMPTGENALVNGIYDPEASFTSRYEVFHKLQLDFFSTFDSQSSIGGKPLREFIFVEDDIRIAGSRTGFTTTLLPDGDRVLNEKDFDSKWDDFGGEDTQPWNQGQDASDGFIDSRIEDSQVKSYSPHVEYVIKKSELPGERSDFYLNSTYQSVTDELPPGKESWNGDYYWRTRTYNVINDNILSQPRVVITSMTNYPTLDYTDIKFTVYADEDIQGCWMFTGWAEHEGYRNTFYYSVETKTPTWEWVSELTFPTDRPDVAGEREQSFENPTVWVPWGYNRSRPTALITDDHQYYLWYSKPNSFNEPSILHARGKGADKFGEYSIVFPDTANESSFSYNGEDAMYSPYVLNNGIYRMWLTMFNGTSNRIAYSESIDAEEWSKPSVVSGISEDSYSPCLIYDGSQYHMWYCKVDTTSKVYYSTSSDGESFTDVNSGNPVASGVYGINTPWVIMEGSGYRMFYTKYDSGGISKIYSMTSDDGIAWINEQVEINTNYSMNPCVIQDYFEGHPFYRMYYNQQSGSDIRIKTALLNDRVWIDHEIFHNEFLVDWWNITGDRGYVPCSSNGIEYNVLLHSTHIPDLQNAEDIAVRLPFYQNGRWFAPQKKDYYVQSKWVSSSNEDDYEANVSPKMFKYSEAMKDIRFGGGYDN